ncbi:4Fe-4S ferredoxin [Trichothermofontia sichuanensis B231]|uniref:circadian clock protein LdpA n=1 Tax=Trichothermofontia sichuanensis TaxID=3045816 RepID=UPI002247D06D|nr:LdpA C-terminal domain-containing domain [Trichothermofontia sichuanensis]UZQ52850.1 4Fe-4S ferredoxin [Trichothermofontia sichuanensis B231]
MTDLYRPLQSLCEGHWFKLICGASYQHLASIRDLTLAYTLAGADCIDVAADPAVITAAQEAIQMATTLNIPDCNLAPSVHPDFLAAHRPWLMVSLNDGEDPHFRKAHFDADRCPTDCPRPCERICPAQAIAFPAPPAPQGVIAERCYGCGRCLPVCPIGQIITEATVVNPAQILPQIMALGIDAIEIHTQMGRVAAFQRLWSAIVPHCPHLKLIAVSFPDGEDAIAYLWTLHDVIRATWSGPLVWQTDGRPMSGDLGKGTTHAALKLAQTVLTEGPPGYVQLAGGTNAHTVTKARQLGLLTPSGQSVSREPGPQRTIAGIAYGSYARAQLRQWLETGLAGEGEREVRREDREARGLFGERLWSAVQAAAALVSPLKAGLVVSLEREDRFSQVPSPVAAARPP